MAAFQHAQERFSNWAQDHVVDVLVPQAGGLRMATLAGGSELRTRLVVDAADANTGASFVLGFDLADEADVSLWAVPTAGVPLRLAECRVTAAGRHRDVAAWLVEPEDGDVSIWMFYGAAGSTRPGERMDQLLCRLEAHELDLVVGCWETADA